MPRTRTTCPEQASLDATRGERLAQFTRNRRLLLGLAYRMLGSLADAEDIVQETYLRWERAKGMEIRDAKSFLTTIATRLCLDQVKSARVRRQTYVGPWLPERIVGGGIAVAAGESADSLSTAFLLLLENLSPPERAAYLLRVVFEHSYNEIAAILGKTEGACRQVVKRARGHMKARRTRFQTDRQTQERLTLAFTKAVSEGDMGGLLALLAEDACVYSDGGGKVAAATRPIRGRDRVARFFIGLARKHAGKSISGTIVEVNGGPGVLVMQNGRLTDVITLVAVGARIGGIYVVRNPDNLERVAVDYEATGKCRDATEW